jgi:hypothetical protein
MLEEDTVYEKFAVQNCGWKESEENKLREAIVQ